MNIASDVLRRYLPGIPTDAHELRMLLDDVGIEVKRSQPDGLGVIYGLELLANRGDHHCYEGVARELCGRLGGEVSLPAVANLETGGGDEVFAVRNLVPELCPVYTATLVAREPGSQAGEVQGPEARVLEAAAIRTLNLPVDATNLSNLELGQPTHVFDADKIVGAVTIRTSTAGELAWPLFHEERVALPEGTLVIADDEKILAVAGVIGCEDSKTTGDTLRVLVESAHFDPVSVRKAHRALGITTDASARFERGSDPSRPLVGAGRVVHLLESIGAWRRQGATVVTGDWADPGRVLLLDLAWVHGFLDHAFEATEVVERLGRYGFVCDAVNQGTAVRVRVPPHRLWDIEFPHDLAEELVRSVGYNATSTVLPQASAGAPRSEAELRREAGDQVLLGLGFYEVVTDGFHGRDLVERLDLPEGHPLTSHVQTSNSLDRAYSLLKNSCFPQAVEAVAVNLRVRNAEVKAFEWTRTFHPVPVEREQDREQAPCEERHMLWAVACGSDRLPDWSGTHRGADATFLAGVVAELGRELGLALEVVPGPGDHALSGLLHPGRQAEVRLGGQTVGVLGEVHPAVLGSFRIKRARPVYLELDATVLTTAPADHGAYTEPPSLQPMERSLAFALPHGVAAGEVAAVLTAAGPDWLEAVSITDLFAFEEEGVQLRAITYALRFAGSTERESDEVNAVLDGLVAAVSEALGSRGVRLRA